MLCVCSLISGPRRYPGIFVDYVRPGSISAEVGLKREDQILSINDIPFNNVTIQQVKGKMRCFNCGYKCDPNHNVQGACLEQGFITLLFFSSGYLLNLFLVELLPGSLWDKQAVYSN